MQRNGMVWWGLLLVCTLGMSMVSCLAAATTMSCTPTRPDSLGPFYELGAPERDRTGQGLLITGMVRSARDCTPVSQARLEWWSANTRGNYDAAHRATQQASAEGQYQYTTDSPGHYPGLPPHVHVRVSAPGYRTLVTQVYPQQGQTTVSLDFVLIPE